MKILEIKNNLVHLTTDENDNPILAKFIIITSKIRSYVAQIIDIKCDEVSSIVTAKLLFTFNTEGVVDNYDGSVPEISANVQTINTSELLELLPIETPIKISNIAHENLLLSLDISIFESNFTVFVERNQQGATVISNCIRQLFQRREKSVVIDTQNFFDGYKRLTLGEDYKLPLNSDLIDFIFNNELNEVEPTTKAVIQNIFYSVQQYIKTLDYEFLPIDRFIDVVTNQYKETQMPELALLKNKLLKYRDANVFANNKEEILALKEYIEKFNTSIIDIKNISGSLQKEIINYTHNVLSTLDKFVYFFVPLSDSNSDKKLLSKLINHDHVFSTIIVPHTHKYATELYQNALNTLIFAPIEIIYKYGKYKTFIEKMNNNECIATGSLTHNIPFILDMIDLDLDLSLEDVLGEQYQFIPSPDNNIMSNNTISEQDNKYTFKVPEKRIEENDRDEIVEEQPEIETVESSLEDNIETKGTQKIDSEDNENTELSEDDLDYIEKTQLEELDEIIDDKLDDTDDELDDTSEDNIPDESTSLDETNKEELENKLEEEKEEEESLENELKYNQNNINYEEKDIINSSIDDIEDINTNTPVVPVYPAEDNTSDDIDNYDFQQGDNVAHPRYGNGVVEKMIKYGNKTLCSISFDNVGRRLLDPSISELTKI